MERQVNRLKSVNNDKGRDRRVPSEKYKELSLHKFCAYLIFLYLHLLNSQFYIDSTHCDKVGRKSMRKIFHKFLINKKYQDITII